MKRRYADAASGTDDTYRRRRVPRREDRLFPRMPNPPNRFTAEQREDRCEERQRERETDINPPFFKDDEALVTIGVESATTLVTQVPLRKINQTAARSSFNRRPVSRAP